MVVLGVCFVQQFSCDYPAKRNKGDGIIAADFGGIPRTPNSFHFQDSPSRSSWQSSSAVFPSFASDGTQKLPRHRQAAKC